MKNRKTYCFLLLVFCFGCACKKLPKETHKGRNIMACYVNGEKWEAKNGFWGDSKCSGGFITGSTSCSPSVVITDEYVKIEGWGKKKKHGDIYLRIAIFNGVGEYLLNRSSFKMNVWGRKISNGAGYWVEGGWNYGTDSIYNGKVNIKYYEEGKICAGTFSFEAINQKGEIAKITDGRFDIGTFNYY